METRVRNHTVSRRLFFSLRLGVFIFRPGLRDFAIRESASRG